MWKVKLTYQNELLIDLPRDAEDLDVRREALEVIDDPYGNQFWGDRMNSSIEWIED